MQKTRLIARLDIKSPHTVKGIRMEGFRIQGDPSVLAQTYDKQGADEILMVDMVASLYQRDPDYALVRAIAKEITIPLTVAGGIASLAHIETLLHAGADKVAINTYAIRHPSFLREASDRFGSQCIVLSVEAKRRSAGSYDAYTDAGREQSGRNVLDWIREAQTLGIGEILLTAIDRDGTRTGCDVDLLQQVQAIATVPVILSGGIADAHSLQNAVHGGADAVAIASVLHDGTWTIGSLRDALDGAAFAGARHA